MPSGGGGATGGCPGMRLVHAHEGSGRGRPGAAGKLAALLDTHPLSPHGERDCGASTSRGAKCPRAHGLELRGTGKRQSALQLRLGLVALLGLDHVRTKPLTTTRNLRLHVQHAPRTSPGEMPASPCLSCGPLRHPHELRYSTRARLRARGHWPMQESSHAVVAPELVPRNTTAG
jgi:hypothetical protein